MMSIKLFNNCVIFFVVVLSRLEWCGPQIVASAVETGFQAATLGQPCIWALFKAAILRQPLLLAFSLFSLLLKPLVLTNPLGW